MPSILPQESMPMASRSTLLNEHFALFHLLIMLRVIINASSDHVLMMYNRALGILKFCGELLILPTLYFSWWNVLKEQNGNSNG